MANSQLVLATLLLILSNFSFREVSAVESLSEVKLKSRILQDSIVKEVNENPKSGWKADLNSKFSDYTVGSFKHILGVKPTPKHMLTDVPVVSYDKSFKLPTSFDARANWPQCTTIGRILDQGHCGSCWAFGAVESLSDRFCVTHGMNISLSANDLVACCGFMCGDGCDGGYPIAAWQYFVRTGVITEECSPYFDGTGCSHPGCEPAYPTPKCVKQCVNRNQVWKNSKHYSVSAYTISSDPHSIMAEVYKNGPVEVSFTVYEDFAHYKSGVYKHVSGGEMGGHSVKLIGWGTSDDGEDYWLISNQWNKGWGEDGLFRIRRGTNECGIEEEVVAGLPTTKNLVREVASTDESIASF